MQEHLQCEHPDFKDFGTSGFQDGLILKTYFIGIYLFDFISPGKRSIQ